LVLFGGQSNIPAYPLTERCIRSVFEAAPEFHIEYLIEYMDRYQLIGISMHYSHLATATNMLWKLIEANGHDPEALFSDAGIAPDLLNKPGARVPYASINKIWAKATDIINDPCFALKAHKYWHPSCLLQAVPSCMHRSTVLLPLKLKPILLLPLLEQPYS
jgi:hypothetical protein